MGYDMQMAEDPENEGYFRLNIWGMGAMRHTMRFAGVFGFKESTTEEALQEDFAKGDNLDLVLLEAWVEALHGEPVPDRKFCSNDGWHVTPVECRRIAKLMRAMLESERGDVLFRSALAADARSKASVLSAGPAPPPEEDGDDFITDADIEQWKPVVEKWAAYNERAAEMGGFRVY